MMNNNCFEKLNIGLLPTNKLFEDCKTFDYGHVDVAKREGKAGRIAEDVEVTATFRQHKVPLEYFKNEPILELIQEFNLTLTQDDQYLVMFAHEHKKDLFMPKDYIYFPYTRLTYEPNKFYLLNTQIPHNSINYGMVPRYVLSMGYYELDPLRTKGPITYDYYYSTINKLKEKNLVGNASSNINN